MSQLLFDEYPLVVSPTLAQKVKLNKAIVLQQLHYWILQKKKRSQKNKNSFRDGHFWVFNTYEEWQQQFPFWSVPTIQRIFLELEEEQLIFCEMFEKSTGNKRKWYRINYQNVRLSDPSHQIDAMGGMTSDCGDDDINLRPSYKEAETTGAAEISQSPDCPAQSDLPKKAKAAKSSKNPFKKRSLENVSYDLEDVEEKRKIARAVRTHGKTAARKAMQRGEL